VDAATRGGEAEATYLAWGSMGAEGEDVIPLGIGGNDGITNGAGAGLKELEGTGDDV